MIDQIVHVNFVTADAKRSVEFYTEVLGARVVRDWQDESETAGKALGISDGPCKWHAYLLRFGDGDEYSFPQIDLVEWIEPKSPPDPPYDSMLRIGIPRICVSSEDLDGLYQRCRERGVPVISEPVPINPRTRRGRRTRVFSIKDPDGIVVEVMGPMNPPDGD